MQGNRLCVRDEGCCASNIPHPECICNDAGINTHQVYNKIFIRVSSLETIKETSKTTDLQKKKRFRNLNLFPAAEHQKRQNSPLKHT